MATRNQKSIFKKMSCGCIMNAYIYNGFSYAVIQGIMNQGCGNCNEDQRENLVQNIWLKETEQCIWEDLLKNYGWTRDLKDKEVKDEKEEWKATHSMKMERTNEINEMFNRYCGEKIERTINTHDID